MARRRFRNNQRHETLTERSFQEFLYSSPAQQLTREELLRLVRGGEDTYLELKVKLSNPEKIAQGICALANTGGGFIIFGVTDQLRIEGLSELEDVQEELARLCREDIVPQITPYLDAVAFDSGRRILALEVKGNRRPYRTRDGRFYIRHGAHKREASYEELAALLDDARPTSYENLPAVGATSNDIDDAHLWSYIRAFEIGKTSGAGLEDYPTGEVMERDLLLAINRDDGFVPTIAGLMLFGIDERIEKLLPRVAVHLTRYGGETATAPVIEQLTINGNLLTIYETMLRFIERYCDLWDARPRASKIEREGASEIDSIQSDVPVVARANYHRASVCEAITNALAHRDLILREHPTRVAVFDRALEITNARRTANFSNVANRAIRYGIPQRLNSQLHAILTNPAYGLRLKLKDPNVELARGGLPMIQREGRLFSGKAVDVHLFNDEFRLRLHAL